MSQLEQLTGTLKYDYDGSGLKGAIKDMDTIGHKSMDAGKQGSAGMSLLKGGALAAGVAFTGVGIAAAGVGVGLASSIGKAAEFEKGLSNIKAVSGGTAAEMELVANKALQIGKDTSFSASQANLAIEELVKGGVNLQDVLAGAADATVALAAAGEVDLPTAAAIITASMNNFGLGAEDMAAAVDTINGAAGASAISVEDFGMSMSAVGAVANTIGFSLDDTAVAITALGKAGIMGSDAGTSLKTMFMNLQPETDEQVALFRELGLTMEDGSSAFFDAEGNVKSMADVAGLLNGALGGMTKAQQLATLETMFGSDAIRAASVLMEQGKEGIEAYHEEMGKTTAADTAATRLDNLTGDVEAFWGSLETLQIIAGRAFDPFMRAITQAGTGLLNMLMPVLEEITPLIEDFFGGLDVGGLMSGLFSGDGLDMGGIGGQFAAIGDSLTEAFSDPAVGEFLANLWERLSTIGAFIIDPLLPIAMDLGVAFAEQFAMVLPVVLDVANALHNNLWPIVESILGFVRDNKSVISDWLILTQAPLVALSRGFESLKETLGGIGDIEMPDVGGWLGGLFGGGEAEAAGAEAGAGFASGFAEEAASMGQSAKEGLMSAAEGLSELGLPPELAQRVADLATNFDNLDAGTLAQELQDITLAAQDLGLPEGAVDDFAALGRSAIDVKVAVQDLAATPPPETSGWFADLKMPDFGEMFSGVEAPDLSSLFEGIELPELDLSGLIPEMPEIDLSGLTDPFTTAWADIGADIDSAWADFDSKIQSAQDAIYDYLMGIWMDIPADIREDLVLIAEHIAEQFEAYRTTIEEKLTEAKDAISTWLSDVQKQWDKWLDDILNAAQDVWSDVKTAIMGPLTEAKTELSTAWASVEAEARAAWDRVRAAVVEKVEAAMSYLTGIRDQVAQRARDAWAGVVEAAHTALDPLVSAVTTKVEAALAYLTGVRNTVEGKAREIWQGFIDATESALARLKDAVLTPIRNAIDGLKTAVTDAKTQALAIGRAIIDGMVSTIVAGKDRLISAALAGVRGLLDAIKGLLGIESPSRVFAEIGMQMMAGMAMGITAGAGMVNSALSGVTSGFLALITGDTEDGAISKAIANMADLSDEWERLQAIADQVNASDPLAGPIRRMNEAMSVFFNSNAVGGLTDLLAKFGAAGFSPDQSSLLERLGFSERSFAEIQAAIDALSGEPEKQAELWGDFIDGLTSAWDEFYRSQVGPLEDQKKALELLKKQYQRDPTRTGTELDPQIEAIQAQIDMWEARNEAISRGIDSHEMGLDGILAAYKRISEAVDATNEQAEAAWEAYERALKAAQDAVKARGAAAEDAEESAHDEVMAMLDAEERRRERAHKADMQALEDRRTKLEEVIAAENAAEEKAHADRMAAITREVDAADAINDAEEARLNRANLLLDTLEKGNALTAEQAAFLRAQGIDPDAIMKTNQGLADAKTNIDKAKLSLDALARSLETLNGFLDKLPDERGRVSIAGGRLSHESGKAVRDGKGAPQTISEAERAALQKGIDDGTLTGSDKRIAEVALAGGVVQAQRLREVLGTLIAPQEAAAEAAAKQLSAAEAILVVQESQLQAARDKLAVDEAALKVAQDEAKTKRDALAPQLAAEDAAHEAWLKAQGERLTAIDLEMSARKAEHDAWKESIDEARSMEEERHNARMKAIRDEYALQLMMLGKTDAEIAAILDEQARRQAAISAEAEERWRKIMADAAALRTPVVGEIGGARGPGIKQPGAVPVLPGDPGRGAKGGKPFGATPFEEFITGAPSMGQMMTELSAAMAPIITALPAITGTGGGTGGSGTGPRDLTNYGVIMVGDEGDVNREFRDALMDFLGA